MKKISILWFHGSNISSHTNILFDIIIQIHDVDDIYDDDRQKSDVVRNSIRQSQRKTDRQIDIWNVFVYKNNEIKFLIARDEWKFELESKLRGNFSDIHGIGITNPKWNWYTYTNKSS